MLKKAIGSNSLESIRMQKRLTEIILSLVLMLSALDAFAASGGGRVKGFVFPDSDHKLIREQELLDADAEMLWQARNEIYVRKGYRFSNTKTKQFFENRKYYAKALDTIKLNTIEQRNVETIKRFENYLKVYPERAFEATYEVTESLSHADKSHAVRNCPEDTCHVIGHLHHTCVVNADIRMDRQGWVYVRSSTCGNAPGPADGYIAKKVLSLVAG